VISVCIDHNYGLSPSKARYLKCYRNLDSMTKRKLEINDRSEIPLSKNFDSLVVEAGGYKNFPFLERDCHNYIDKARHLQLGEGGAESLLDYFIRMRQVNDGFYFQMDLDGESRLRNVFWADARSRACYEDFGDVVTFDTIYLTNKYGMRVAPFVGVNHHGESILFGVRLLSDENI
jgi:hypothetical protein